MPPIPPSEPAVYRVPDLAARWRCSPGKVRAVIAAGDIACLKLGRLIRIPANAVIEYEAKCLTPALPVSARSEAERLGCSITSARRISTGTTSRVEAEEVLAEYRRGLERPGRPGAAIGIATILARYLTDRRERDTPGADRLSYAHKLLIRHFGDKPPEVIGEAELRYYGKARKTEGVGVATVRTELAALRAAVRWAAGRGRLIGTAPFIELPKRPPARERWLTREEAAALIDNCQVHHVSLFVRLALGTAARSGAILALTWDRVDLEKRRIDFNELGRPQTRKRRAVVPLNETLFAELQQAKAGAVTPYVIEWGGCRVLSVKRAFRQACQRAGLRGVTPHTLRHTAVTWMMQAGVDIWQAAGMAGMTVQTVQETYAKHHPSFLKDAADALK